MGASWNPRLMQRAAEIAAKETRAAAIPWSFSPVLDVGRQPSRRFNDAQPAPVWTPDRLYRLFPNLAEMPGRLGGRMSGGEQQMLTVARTLMGNPFLILLDEPSEGVAPVIVEGWDRPLPTLSPAAWAGVIYLGVFASAVWTSSPLTSYA